MDCCSDLVALVLQATVCLSMTVCSAYDTLLMLLYVGTTIVHMKQNNLKKTAKKRLVLSH